MHIESGRHLYGGAKQVSYLIEGLKKRGVENTLLCPPGSDIAKACAPFCRVVETKMGGDLDIGMIFRIRRAILEHRPDIVHLHSRRGADIMGALAARSTGTPVILSRRVDNPESPLWVRLKYRLYDHIITISEGIRRVLLSEGVEESRATCVHSAVDTSAYQAPCDKAAFRALFGLDENSLTIGVIAQLIDRKGHRFLLDILPSLIEKHPNLRVIFFGKGPLKERLKETIEAKHLQKHVTLAGFREDLHRWIGCLDLVVHPALMEGLGVSLLQAAAAGVPIVAAPFGGMPEIVHDGVNGFLVDPRDEKKLTEAIERLLEDASLRRAMGEKGRALVEKNFSIDAMVEGNLAIYEKVIS